MINLTKPFHPDELAAWIEALLRRSQRFEEVLELKHRSLSSQHADHRYGDNSILCCFGKEIDLFHYFLRDRTRS